MSENIRNRIEYTVMCISEFSQRHSLPPQKAYKYLKDYGGMAFLKDCYEAEHQLSIIDAVNDLTQVCRNQGGKL